MTAEIFPVLNAYKIKNLKTARKCAFLKILIKYPNYLKSFMLLWEVFNNFFEIS